MIRPSYPSVMKTIETNSISIPTDEFHETFETIRELLELNVDPRDFVVSDPFLSSSSPKVDLRRHLKSLFERMREVRKQLTPETQMVTIEFN